MEVWYFFAGGLFCLILGYFFGKMFGCKKKIDRDKMLNVGRGLRGTQKKVWDILDKQDGVGFFRKIALEYRIDKGELNGAVKSLKKEGFLREKVFSSQRKLYLKDYLNLTERRVLGFVEEAGGDVEFCVIMEKLGIDDNMLIRIGKKLVRMKLIVKIRRGWKTFFVLRDKI